PDDPTWINRDRFFLDPGHLSPLLYSTLTLFGSFTVSDLQQFRQWGSHTPGHPELDPAHGIENTSGPLGLGHGMGLGAGLAERFLAARFGEWLAHKTYIYISDGGIQEEISQGVGRIAGHLGLGNIIMFYDSNRIQLSHETSAVTSEDTAAKYKAWQWNVISIDGHDHYQIRAALQQASSQNERPTLIIGRTIMGKGSLAADGACFESRVATHGQPLSKAGGCVELTIKNLGGDPETPFAVFGDVAEYCAKVKKQKTAAAAAKKQAQTRWEAENPDQAKRLHAFFSGTLPPVDFNAIRQKEDIATRAASGAVLAVLAESVENMIVASADLSNSDNTEAFLKKTKIFAKGDFSGKFLQIGVSELTMAAIANGLALHGGVIPVCATFFVFSDYMKPAVRLAALMGLPVTYIWTHDSFRVGEDGPTHEPVEHEAQLRLLEKMKNLKGRRSMLVLRPADGPETTVAWEMAFKNNITPTALILTRQNVHDLPAGPEGRAAAARQARHGAYIVAKKGSGAAALVLLANGSEVSLLCEAVKLANINPTLTYQVVSVISEGLFREQPQEYRHTIIPPQSALFGVTAGLACALEGLAGHLGKIYGLDRFGASAPSPVLDEQFGFTPAKIASQIESFIEELPARREALKRLAEG
ncbi:MAG: hypothetical protein PHC61_09165, partial [Chitinivibrionales bacterium]|nr:hypothetical protein [Chitinivibrionales bacterium]